MGKKGNQKVVKNERLLTRQENAMNENYKYFDNRFIYFICTSLFILIPSRPENVTMKPKPFNCFFGY